MPANPIIVADQNDTPPAKPSGFVAIKIPLRLIGIFLLLLVTLSFAAFVSWSVDDPSLSYASAIDKSPSNWLGFPGAVLADIWMQFFGLASLFFLVPPAIWAWRLIGKNSPNNILIKIFSLIGATILLAGTFSCFSVPSSWPLPTGLGGLVGSSFTSLAQFVTGSAPTGTASIIYAIILLPPTLALLWISIDPKSSQQIIPTTDDLHLNTQEINDDDLAADDQDKTGFFDIAFGAIMHFSYTAKTAWRRTLNTSKQAREEEADQEWQRQTGEPNMTPVLDAELKHQTGTHFERIEPSMEASGQNDISQDTAHYEEQEYRQELHSNEVTLEAASYEETAPFETTQTGDDHLARLNVEQSRPAHARSGATQGNNENAPVAPAPDFVSPKRNNPATANVEPAAKIAQGGRLMREAQGSLLEDTGFCLPELALLATPEANAVSDEHHPDELEIKARQLEGVLDDFGIKGDIINVRPGPVVTLYELEPAPGIKSSRIISLADDIARSMSAISARVAVIPGRNAIGIELPNAHRETVFLREMLASRDFEKVKGKLPICLGKTIGGEPVVADLARMPHLLIAGTTGSGKSVAVNTMILSLLYRMTPEQCRLIMIDPKMLELSIYDGIPHLLSPVVTDPSKAVVALKWAVREMEDRYRKMSKIGVRNIEGFNTRVTKANKKGETITRTVQTGFDRETGEAIYESESFALQPLPYIVIIVDEMADLMMVAGKDIEGAIQRLAQMARAAGIHLVMATQRPSVDVITGTIKANFPTRISFQVTSKIDSRTILGEMGAEQLLGMGDMLYMAGGGRVKRLHGPFVSDTEVEDIVAHLKEQGTPDYLENITEDVEEAEEASELGNSGDELYDKAINIVLNDRKASTSYIQRRLSIGYNRAATLIEKMEAEGVISAANHAGKREVLVGDGVDH